MDTNDGDALDLRMNNHVEDGKDIYLVDWYGLDDPEVVITTPIPSMGQTFLTCFSESTELAQQLEIARLFPDLSP